VDAGQITGNGLASFTPSDAPGQAARAGARFTTHSGFRFESMTFAAGSDIIEVRRLLIEFAFGKFFVFLGARKLSDASVAYYTL
jgi:hypothetical protein